MRIALLSLYLLGATSITFTAPVLADTDGCSHFTWDVSHELAVMKQTAKPVTAAAKPDVPMPQLQIDELYELKLAPQSTVSYRIPPAKPTVDASAHGGLMRLRVARSGLYRISITSGHWIDVTVDDQLVKSKDFQGSHSCARPHKIVEFELPANRELILQLSGATEASVLMAITAVADSAVH